jgi:hypothetical protein
MKKIFYFLILLLTSHFCLGQTINRYTQPSVSKIKPLDYGQMSSVPNQLRAKHDLNFQKLEYMALYIQDIIENEEIDEKLDKELDGYINLILKYSRMGLAHMDSDLMKLEVDINKSVNNFNKRSSSIENSEPTIMRFQKDAPVYNIPFNPMEYSESKLVFRVEDKLHVIEKYDENYFKVRLEDTVGYIHKMWAID